MKFALSKKEVNILLPILKTNKETSQFYRFNHVYINQKFIYFGNTDLEIFLLNENFNNKSIDIDNTEYVSIVYKDFLKIVKNIENIEFEIDNECKIINFIINNVRFKLENKQRIEERFFFDYQNLGKKIQLLLNSCQTNEAYKAILPIICNMDAYMQNNKINFLKDNLIIKILRINECIKNCLIYQID